MHLKKLNYIEIKERVSVNSVSISLLYFKSKITPKSWFLRDLYGFSKIIDFESVLIIFLLPWNQSFIST